MNIPLAVPFIHSNGDRAETLVERLETAYSAVNSAMDALRQCAPNGRNAYPVDGLMQLLEDQHRQRQSHLQAVLDSLAAEANAIQGAARRETVRQERLADIQARSDETERRLVEQGFFGK